MVRKVFAFTLIMILLLRITSCQKITEPIEQVKGASQFPMSVGSTWEYSIVDTVVYTYTGQTEVFYDTVKVSIVGITNLPDGNEATVWQYQYRDTVDTLFANLAGDTLFFYQKKGDLLLLKSRFILPLQVDKQWQLSVFDYRVERADTVQVPAGVFINVFDVLERPRVGNVVGLNHYFIAPQVGIVKYHSGTFSTFSEVNHKIEWKLFSYTITD